VRRRWPEIPWEDARWSYTTLDLWRCPYRAHQVKVRKQEEPVGEALQDGRVLHDAIGAYIAHLMEANLASDPGAMEEIARGIFFDPAPREPHGLPLGAWDEIRALARSFAENFILDPEKVLCFEEPVAIPLGPGDWWLGVIDLAEAAGDECWVSDWKSDHHLPSRAEAEDSFQLRVYAWMMARTYRHLKRFHCALRYLRYGLRPRWVDFTREEALAAEEEILGRVEQVKALLAQPPRKGMPAVAGSYCRFCGFAAACPARKRMGEAAPPLIQDDLAALEAAAELTAIDRRRNQLRDALKAYTAANGSIALDGLEYGHFLSESQTVDDVAELARRLEAAGIDPFEYLQPAAAKLEALLANPDTRGLAEDLLVDTSHTQFRSRRARKAVAAR
jgi:hypothetical protein